MKTIEKANKVAVHAENFEDIIFEGRNHNYGAYSLRKNYNKHLLFSLLSVFFIANIIVAITFLYSKTKPPIVKEPQMPIVICTLSSDLFKPELPPPPAKKVTAQSTLSDNSNAHPVVSEDPVAEEIPPQEDLIEQTGSIEIPDVIQVTTPDPAPVNVEDPNTTYNQAQVSTQALFKKGSVDIFRKWLSKNIYYPLDALTNDIKGTVLVKFTIDKNGKICDITIIRGLDPTLDQAAIKTLKSSPEWTAATINGKPVKVSYILPIAFNIQR